MRARGNYSVASYVHGRPNSDQGYRNEGRSRDRRRIRHRRDNMTEISISTPHHRLKGYLAEPQGEGPWPAVIVLHDIFGLTDVTRRHADWLGNEGYLAVALDLFSCGGRVLCLRALLADLCAGQGGSVS